MTVLVLKRREREREDYIGERNSPRDMKFPANEKEENFMSFFFLFFWVERNFMIINNIIIRIKKKNPFAIVLLEDL